MLSESVLLNILYHTDISILIVLKHCRMGRGGGATSAAALHKLVTLQKELYALFQAVGVVHRQGPYLHVLTY